MLKKSAFFLSLSVLAFQSAFLPRGSDIERDLYEAYRDKAARIAAAAMSNAAVFEKLVHLCDRIGHRLSGSEALEEAIHWAAGEMRRDGLEKVRFQPVEVPHWVRGEEAGRITAPVERPLRLLGLGGTVSTPADGMEAEVLVVSSFEDLEGLGRANVEGKMVLFNVPFQGYGRTVVYRTQGPSKAAQFGATAALVRSVTPVSLQTPHTGALRYDPAAHQIPAAAITIEDAELIQRLIDRNEKVRVYLKLEGRLLPPAKSANVIGELSGRELPGEVVVIGGHIDSWDVGQGAHDDGAGVVAAMQAPALLKELGLRPRRTIRTVLFTNEENGLAGARVYFESVSAEILSHAAAVEMDFGAEKPVGFGFTLPESIRQDERALQALRSIGRLLEFVDAGQMTPGGGGADIAPLMRAGVPGFGLRTVGESYFDWHHTHADTVDKVDPEHLRAAMGAMAILAYVLADMPERVLSE
ncbi:MAG TPA: M20/M25/M40 family metallo-hydrolase [Acidobacteriota bacterium]|nr:M20/M25/M40 family metallo-hydrolase [Acidobacteriota bacterium]